MTLLEALEHADAVDIDGHFIRYFNFTTEEQRLTNDPDEVVFEAKIIDEEFCMTEYLLSEKELLSAVFDKAKQAWACAANDITIQPIKIAVITPGVQ